MNHPLSVALLLSLLAAVEAASGIHLVQIKKRQSSATCTKIYGHPRYRSSLGPLAFKSSSWVRKRGDTTRQVNRKGAGAKNGLLSCVQVVSSRFKRAVGDLLGFDRIIESVFEDADTNHDGTISLSEAHTLILQMYVKLNRAAPIPPPSHEKVDAIFAKSDVDRNQKLSKAEFAELATIFASRATTRLVAHKIVSFVVAPLLAIKTVEGMSGKDLSKLSKLLPASLKERFADENVWKTVLTVVFVKSLGDVVISSVTMVMDALQLKKK